MNIHFNNEFNEYELGIDEAGRGPLFGRVYAAAVILPKINLKLELIKDSKKFNSYEKLLQSAEYIKNNSIKWAVAYCDETEIDNYNIRKATHYAMHKASRIIIDDLDDVEKTHLLVDGIDFTPMTYFKDNILHNINYTCIKQGDNKYYSIAAASILAKSERDKYILDLCENEPELHEKYYLKNNKGYGTKQHINGIIQYGVSKYHRKSFGICKNYNI